MLRLEQVRAHLLWCVGTYFPTWNCHRGSPGLHPRHLMASFMVLYSTSGWVKRLKHIHLDVSHLDPAWIHLDPPIWGIQGGLWPDVLIYGILGPFWTVPEPLFGTSGWVKRLKHIHLDVSHLDPTWIHQFGAPRAAYGPICLIYGRLGQFLAIKMGKKAKNWISYFLNQTDKIEPLVRPK